MLEVIFAVALFVTAAFFVIDGFRIDRQNRKRNPDYHPYDY